LNSVLSGSKTIDAVPIEGVNAKSEINPNPSIIINESLSFKGDTPTENSPTLANNISISSKSIDESIKVVDNLDMQNQADTTVQVNSVVPQPVSRIVPPMLQGFLRKQGRHGIKTWKSRYFVLDNGILKYFEYPISVSPFGQNLKGSLNLKSFNIVQSQLVENYHLSIPEEYSKFSIYLTNNTINNPLKQSSGEREDHLLLSCEDHSSFTSWIAALTMHIAYANS
jgi:hypothetical protein